MPIEYRKQDITTVESGVVVHGCNCLGVMGAGVAKAIKQRWPQAYLEYAWVCVDKDPAELLGSVHWYEAGEALLVANAFTQIGCGTDKVHADTTAIRSALYNVANEAVTRGLPVYMPLIGCGLGGLKWETDVKPIVEEVVAKFPQLDVIVCLV